MQNNNVEGTEYGMKSLFFCQQLQKKSWLHVGKKSHNTLVAIPFENVVRCKICFCFRFLEE